MESEWPVAEDWNRFVAIATVNIEFVGVSSAMSNYIDFN